MKLTRTKNTIRNIYWGIINRIIVLVLPFFTRTVIIKFLGADYLGLGSLFTSILHVLSLAELGFSSAVVFSMYKSIANEDKDMICALLNLYKKAYKVIGFLIFIFGIAMIPLLDNFIKGSYPNKINIYLLYIIYLLNTTLSYWLFAYKRSLFAAHQRNDIISRIETVTKIIQNLSQIAVLMIFRNYYLFVIVSIITTILDNFIVAVLSKKQFPEYVCRGKIQESMRKDITKRISGLMITKIASTTRTTFDSIFISSFIGITTVAIYGNYFYIMSSVHSILIIFITAIRAGVGNSMVTESVEKNYQDMKRFNFIYAWISGWCTICLASLYQHFMLLWVGRELMFSTPVMLLFSAYFYILTMGDIRYIYHEAAGLWWEGRYRAILEAIANLVLNLLFVSRWGVFGIVLGTLISMLVINFGYGSTIVFKHYFKNYYVSEFFKQHMLYLVVTCINCIITYLICSFLPGIGLSWFVVKMTICIFLPNVFYFLFYFKTKEFKYSLGLGKKIINSFVK